MISHTVHHIASACKAFRTNDTGKDNPVPAIFSSRDHRPVHAGGPAFLCPALDGREDVVPFVFSNRQANQPTCGKPREAELLCRKGRRFFDPVRDVPGIGDRENNLAATSKGKVFGGEKLRLEPDRHLAHRRRLQFSGRLAATRQPIGPAKAAVTQPVVAITGSVL
ncbi:MAG: hypothetical protein M1532_01585 [Nitrospirae bacterium]|jgi:hypothetical protein|nr:hypothetical protein [Nitrospirota bacterium]